MEKGIEHYSWRKMGYADMVIALSTILPVNASHCEEVLVSVEVEEVGQDSLVDRLLEKHKGR